MRSIFFWMFWFVATIVAIDQAVFGSDRCFAFLYRHRPDAGSGLVAIRQRMQLEYFRRQRDTPKVLFVGSSSVVNGIDVKRLAPLRTREGQALVPVNLGQTGFLASELPLEERYLLYPQAHTVVFAYNYFSFADSLHPSGLRWNTRQFARYAPVHFWLQSPLEKATAALQDELFSVRYLPLIRNAIFRWSRHRDAPPPSEFDYAVDETLPPVEKRVLDSHDTWENALYRESAERSDTLGYLGLRRFLLDAKKRGVQVVVMPAPEPDLAANYQPRRGLDEGAVDTRVQAICEETGTRYFPRRDVRWLEVQGERFRDRIHLSTAGRNIYTDFLADTILPRVGVTRSAR